MSILLVLHLHNDAVMFLVPNSSRLLPAAVCKHFRLQSSHSRGHRAVFRANVSGIHVQDIPCNLESLFFLETCGQSGNVVEL